MLADDAKLLLQRLLYGPVAICGFVRACARQDVLVRYLADHCPFLYTVCISHGWNDVHIR